MTSWGTNGRCLCLCVWRIGLPWRKRNFRVTNATTLVSSVKGGPCHPDKEVVVPLDQMQTEDSLGLTEGSFCLVNVLCTEKGLELTNLVWAKLLTFQVFQYI